MIILNKKINKLIRYYKSEIKEHHLKRMQKEYKDSPDLKTVDGIIEFVNDWDWSFSPDMDLSYLMGKVAVLEELLRKLGGEKK